MGPSLVDSPEKRELYESGRVSSLGDGETRSFNKPHQEPGGNASADSHDGSSADALALTSSSLSNY